MMIKNKFVTCLISVGLLILILAVVAQSAIPPFFNYQGRLNDSEGNPVPDGVYNMIFNIYDSYEGGSAIWTSESMPITVENGLFSVQLGIIGSDIFTLGSERFLGIKVGDDPEMAPRTQFLMVPYATYASEAGYASVHNGSICDIHISDTANIDRDKIDDVAAVLYNINDFHSANQFGWYTLFQANVDFVDTMWPGVSTDFYDSTMRVDNNGIRIGNADLPVAYSPLTIERHYNVASPNSRYGALSYVYNSNTGTLFGMWSKAQRTSSTATAIRTYGVYGISTHDYQVGTPYGVYGNATGGLSAYGIYGDASGGANYNWAGYFDDDVFVAGTLFDKKSAFRIDDPLDPENKFLCHSAVTSPDMKNVYDGVVKLDGNGRAIVTLPDYFEALNKDFRYQLTPIGAPGPNLYIAEKISGNRFMIAGGEPGMEISWQVTGIRKDPFAEDNRIEVNVDKYDNEKGLYLYPEGYGYGEERSIDYDARQQAIEASKGTGGDEL